MSDKDDDTLDLEEQDGQEEPERKHPRQEQIEAMSDRRAEEMGIREDEEEATADEPEEVEEDDDDTEEVAAEDPETVTAEQAKPPPPQPPEPQVEDEQEPEPQGPSIEELREKAYLEGDEEAIALYEDALFARFEERTRERQRQEQERRAKAEFAETSRWFAESYPDIANDPDMSEAATAVFWRQVKQGKPMKEAAQYAGDRFSAPKQDADELARRRDIKRGLADHSGMSKRSPARPEQREPTASETIAMMRKARGQSL